MIQFKSLIKIDDVYIEVQEIVSALQVENLDWEYIEGKILIFYNGKEIFGSEITDDINWFWGFIVDGFDVFFEQGTYEVGFPSQAIHFSLTQINSNNVHIRISSETRVHLNKDFILTEFLNGFLNGALEYYHFEKKFNKNEIDEIERQMSLIESYTKKIAI